MPPIMDTRNHTEYLHLEVKNYIKNGKSKRITHLSEDGISKKIEIFYEFDRIIPWSENTILDGHVFAILLHALSRGKNLKIHGTVSRSAMRNIEELQSAWCRWKPELYTKIEIIPDHIDDTRKQHTEEKAISAFSGGLDATFTALRHTKILPENIRYPLRSVLMVHGFDVDIYNITDFNRLIKRTQPIISDLNLELRTIRTNSRELKLQNWDDSHALELAACLHMYSEEFEFGLIGSSDPYDEFAVPWGSNPVTDHLISNNRLSIIHDGTAFSRTEKAKEIINYPLAIKTIKVCWAGADQSKNCGQCEKCLRTQLNFIAAGLKSPPQCFTKKFNIEDINNVKIYTAGQLKGMINIVTYAKKHNVNGEWLSALETRIATWRPVNNTILKQKEKGGILKQTLVKILINIGCDKPVKKLWRYTRRHIFMYANNSN